MRFWIGENFLEIITFCLIFKHFNDQTWSLIRAQIYLNFLLPIFHLFPYQNLKLFFLNFCRNDIEKKQVLLFPCNVNVMCIFCHTFHGYSKNKIGNKVIDNICRWLNHTLDVLWTIKILCHFVLRSLESTLACL